MSVTVEDAKNWIHLQLSDKDWMDAVDAASKSTVCRSSSTEIVNPYGKPTVEVIGMTTCDVAKDLIRRQRAGQIDHRAKVVIHNFADQKLVGGYFNKKTSSAQEESICANTGLYGILLSHSFEHEMLYQNTHEYSISYLNSHYIPMLYHPNVPIAMKSGVTRDFGLVDIVTAAARNIRKESNKPVNYEELVEEQIFDLFDFVASQGDNEEIYFITGAWGCGVFGNDPNYIYSTMNNYVNLQPEGNGKMHIIIAVPGGHNLFVAYDVFGKPQV